MGCLTLECYANNLAKVGGGGTKGRDGLLRNGKRAGGVMIPHGQRKDPQGVPVGRGDWLGLFTGESRQNEKEGEKDAKPKVA